MRDLDGLDNIHLPTVRAFLIIIVSVHSRVTSKVMPFRVRFYDFFLCSSHAADDRLLAVVDARDYEVIRRATTQSAPSGNSGHLHVEEV
jgi:hypothetical protein